MDPPAVARAYYERVDAGAYGRLRDLLAPGFAHERPDRTLAGPDRFVRFMREERPDPDTTHEIAAVYAAVGEGRRGSGETGTDAGADGPPARTRVAAEGRLLAADGEPHFGFVDVFEVTGGRIARLATYSRPCD